MGSETKEKWLLKLKDSVQNHSEQLPDNFWEDLKKDIPAVAPAAPGRYRKMIIWAASAAAVIVMALLLIRPYGEKRDTLTYIAQNTPEQPAVEEIDSNLLEVGKQVAVALEKAEKEQVQVGENAMDANEDEVGVESGSNTKDAEDAEDVAIMKDKERQEVKRNGEVGKTDEAALDSREKEQQRQGELQRQKEREEYLKELEYLQEKESGKRSRSGRFMAFAGGNAGGKLPDFSSDTYDDDTINDTMLPGVNIKPDGGASSEITPPGNMGNNGPDNFGGFINMDYQPVGDVVWLGANAPQIFVQEETVYSFKYDHKTPVRLSLSFAWESVRGFWFETGISYQYLKSTAMIGRYEAEQKLHYIGIPLRFSLRMLQTGRFSAYASAGYMLEKCIYGNLSNGYDVNEKLDIKRLQSSVNLSAGAQLDVGGGAALYLEPGLYWYLGMDEVLTKQNGYIIKSIYSENPKGFSVQGGVRFTF